MKKKKATKRNVETQWFLQSGQGKASPFRISPRIVGGTESGATCFFARLPRRLRNTSSTDGRKQRRKRNGSALARRGIAGALQQNALGLSTMSETFDKKYRDRNVQRIFVFYSYFCSKDVSVRIGHAEFEPCDSCRSCGRRFAIPQVRTAALAAQPMVRNERCTR